MMRHVGRWLGIVLMGSGAAACAGRPAPVVSPAEARIRTAGEARQLVLQALAADSGRQTGLRLDAAEVQEQPAEWWVYLPASSRAKPTGEYRVVDKRTGAVRLVVAL
jgi:hypothetical protein